MGKVIFYRGQGDVSPGQQGVVGVRRFVRGGEASGLPVVDVFPGIYPFIKFSRKRKVPWRTSRIPRSSARGRSGTLQFKETPGGSGYCSR